MLANHPIDFSTQHRDFPIRPMLPHDCSRPVFWQIPLLNSRVEHLHPSRIIWIDARQQAQVLSIPTYSFVLVRNLRNTSFGYQASPSLRYYVSDVSPYFHPRPSFDLGGIAISCIPGMTKHYGGPVVSIEASRILGIVSCCLYGNPPTVSFLSKNASIWPSVA